MKENILAILSNATDNNYIDTIINSFSYEERLNFYNEMYLTKDETLYNKLKYILTSDEIVNIIEKKYGYEIVNSMLDLNSKEYFISLFNSLNIDNKVKEFLKLNKSLMIYNCNGIFNTDELKSEFIDRIDKTKDEYERLERVINTIIINIDDFDTKIKCIDKISFLSSSLINFIVPLNKEEMNHAFNDLDLDELTKSYLILRCINSDISKEYFLKLNNGISKSVAFKRFSKEYIFNSNQFLDEDKKLDSNYSFDEIKEIFMGIKDIYKVLSLKEFSDEEKYMFLPLLDEKNKTKLLKTISDYKLLFRGFCYLKDINNIYEILESYNGKFPNYDKAYDKLLNECSKVFGVNNEHLIELSKIVSIEIIKNLDKKNIVSLINMPDNDFNKFISFFNINNIKLNSYSLNNIFEAFANKSFNVNFDYIKHYFTDVMKFSQNGNVDKAKETLNVIFNNTDKSILKDYNVDIMYELLKNNDEKAINDFHKICNEYIEKMRIAEIKISIKFYADEQLNSTYEVNSAIKKIISYGTAEWIYEKYLSKILNLFSPREIELLNNKELFKQIYDFKLNPTKAIPPIVKTNMFSFNKIMDKFYSEFKSDKEILDLLSNTYVKKVPEIPSVDTTFLINIMSHLNANEIKEKLLNDDSLCIGLNNLFKKYNFLAFNSVFEDIQIETDSFCDHETVASIFLNYSDIMKNLKKAKMQPSMTSILDLADTYNKNSKIYKYIFEDENFKFISLNPPKNRASILRSKRREISLLNYIKCYNRNRVSVPSFDENITANNKTINVVVGNFTNPINLTYGERTESCMRSGGDGDSLYNYCLNNDNGFHIRFTDPKTGEFISRISGFRNGNTVFLNQLRNSVLDNYDINDLLEICKKTSKEIIERSKNSEFPIDNVVVSYDKEKMEKYGVIPTDLNVSKTSITENQNIWFDLSPKTAVVLSSSNEDNTLVPIKLGLDKISYYPVIRDKIKISLNSNEGINHIEAVEQMLSGKRLDDISLPNNEYDVCYYGEDWYVAITKDGNIVKKIMSKSKDYESAFEEMIVALNNIENVEKIFNETSYKK